MLEIVEDLRQEDVFHYELFVSTRIHEFMGLPLPKQQIQSLLRLQYEAQTIAYECQFPQAKHELVYVGGICIGRMITDIQSDSIHLVDISLFPQYRGNGYGTEVMKGLQNFSMERGLPITLQVFQGNPAQHLYERCGFYMTAELGPYIAMRWNPDYS
ncbi:GNAT family N-acetyltransferase [Solibacillus sp. FSL H8-0538]|uniref:GNAT family N-acetyltransferase n=1 Tax=Solibacillus sp. FSL H8-0538 TaxID=2921400 RepID=UPI0030FAC363